MDGQQYPQQWLVHPRFARARSPVHRGPRYGYQTTEVCRYNANSKPQPERTHNSGGGGGLGGVSALNPWCEALLFRPTVPQSKSKHTHTPNSNKVTSSPPAFSFSLRTLPDDWTDDPYAPCRSTPGPSGTPSPSPSRVRLQLRSPTLLSSYLVIGLGHKAPTRPLAPTPTAPPTILVEPCRLTPPHPPRAGSCPPHSPCQVQPPAPTCSA